MPLLLSCTSFLILIQLTVLNPGECTCWPLPTVSYPWSTRSISPRHTGRWRLLSCRSLDYLTDAKCEWYPPPCLKTEQLPSLSPQSTLWSGHGQFLFGNISSSASAFSLSFLSLSFIFPGELLFCKPPVLESLTELLLLESPIWGYLWSRLLRAFGKALTNRIACSVTSPITCFQCCLGLHFLYIHLATLLLTFLLLAGILDQ